MTTDNQRVAVASDHAGFALKQKVVAWLTARGRTVDDCGPASAERVDYPDFADKVAAKVATGEAGLGVLVCGSGIGMAMRANRVPRVRAANCTLVHQAKMTRLHNDANVLCLGERVVGEGLAEDILDTFLNTAFEGGRHQARVDKIDNDVPGA